MGLFRHRPFAFALFCFLVAFVSVYALSDRGILNPSPNVCFGLFVGISALSFFVSVLLLVTAVRKPKHRTRCVCAIIAVLLFGFGALRSGSYFLTDYGRAQTLVGKTVDVTLSLKELESSSAGYARYYVTAEDVLFDGERFPLSEFNAVLVLETAGEYHAGDRISLLAEGCALAEIYDYPAYAIADGLLVGFRCAEVEDGETAEIVLLSETETEDTSFFFRIVLFARRVQKQFSFVLSEGLGGNVGAFAAAVLVGDRSGLDASVTRDFGRSGISHLLALSGLHISILIGGFAWMLKKLRFPRAAVSALTLLAIFAFLLLTGFSMSACRAGLMLGCAAFLGFFARRPDAVTSLFLAAFILLSVMPSAVASVGLWMSCSSVLGLLVLASKWSAFFHSFFPKEQGGTPLALLRRIACRMLYGIVSGIGISLIAGFSILPVLYISGGEFSLFSVLTNLFTVVLMPCLLVLSVLFLIGGRLVLIGTITAVLLQVIGGWILSVASFVSEIPNASVSLSYPFAGFCVAVFLLPTVFLLIVSRSDLRYLKHRFGRVPHERQNDVKVRELGARWFLMPPTVATASYMVCLVLSLHWFSYFAPLPVTVQSVSGGEMMAVSDGGSAVIIDLADGYYSSYRAAISVAKENGAVECARLVLTHYSSRQISSVTRLCNECLVRKVLMPPPSSEKEGTVVQTLCDRLDCYGVEYSFYECGEALAVTDTVTLTRSEAVYLDRSTQPIFMLSLRAGGESLTYLTPAIEESTLSKDAEALLAEADVVVYGSDGPKRDEAYRLSALGNEARLILTYGSSEPTEPISDLLDAMRRNQAIVWEHNAEIRKIWELCAE